VKGGRRKRLFAVGKERTFHLSVGMSPSFSTSPKIMDQGDDCFFNSLGGRFMFQVRTSNQEFGTGPTGGKNIYFIILFCIQSISINNFKVWSIPLHSVFIHTSLSSFFQCPYFQKHRPKALVSCNLLLLLQSSLKCQMDILTNGLFGT